MLVTCFPCFMILNSEVISLNFLYYCFGNVCERHFEKSLQRGLVCTHHVPPFTNWSNPEQAGIPNSANSRLCAETGQNKIKTISIVSHVARSSKKGVKAEHVPSVIHYTLNRKRINNRGQTSVLLFTA